MSEPYEVYGGPTPLVTQQGQSGVDDPTSDIFFAAIETTRMPIILCDPNQHDTPIVFANNAFIHMVGYPKEEIVGRNCRFLQGAETDRAVVAEIREAIATNKEIAVEILNYKKDGSSFWNALFISPVYNKSNELVYLFASQLDVSRRRDAEEALRQAQKMEAVGQLTGGIAHDFNNLLQVIMGYMDGLKEQASQTKNARMVRQVAAVEDAAQKASKLTQQLLAFSRKQKLEGRIINLNRLITGMQELVTRTLGDDIEISLDLQTDLSNCRIDPSQFEMAMLNVMINARDAMPNSGSIAISTAEIDIDAAEDTMKEGRYICMSIRDTGTGMPEEILRHVTEPFFTTKEEGRGTGLGLSMVYGFAKQSGGIMKIESEVGVGTTVSLLFPVTTSQDDVGGDVEVKKNKNKGGSEKILVVEDRTEVADLAVFMLEDLGYNVGAALTAAEALSELKTAHYDLIFTDLIMPGGMNGVALAREAKRLYPQVKILLTTGYADTAIERKDNSGQDFVTIGKPYRRADLAKKVRLVLDGPDGVS